MFYEISRGVKAGKNLTTAQRVSSKFAEEPVVLGKVLRRGYPPIRINEEQYQLNQTQLKTLEKAGAISITPVGAPAVETAEPSPAPSAAPVAAVEVAEEAALEPVSEPLVEAAPVEAVNDQITDAVTQAAPVVEEVVEKKSKKSRKE